MTVKNFIKLMDMLYNKYIKAVVTPGEAIGSIAAQSIG